MRCIIEAAFIQSLQPEFNQNKHPAHIWTALQLIGWDCKAAEKARWILGKIDKTEPEKKIFVAILQELLSTSNKLKPQPIPENWRPSNRSVVLWRYEGKYLPCHVREIVEENSEAAIYLSTTRETTRIAKEKGLKSARWGRFYVPLSELRPAQGLGLSILKQMALLGLA